MDRSLSVRSILDAKSRFLGQARENPPVWIDSLPPAGDGAGYLPMELLLLSLASSSGSTLAGILRKMSQKVTGMEVQATGQRRDEIPALFTAIEIEFVVIGDHVDPRLVEKGIDMTQDTYCPVWALLKTVVPIQATYRLIQVESLSDTEIEG